jgi:hypothetical protein
MLTREQIYRFAHEVAVGLQHLPPAELRLYDSLGLIDTLTRDLTPRGHDLLATVPHLPAIEPEAPAPSCSRCGGSGEVPLFMGPMSGGGTMPCSVCRPAKPRDWSSMCYADVLDDVEKIHASMHRHWVAATSVPVELPQSLLSHGVGWTSDAESQALIRMGLDPGYQFQQRPINANYVSVGPSPTSGPVPADDRPVGEGWVHIDSDETARRFAGQSVTLHAAAGDDGYDVHRMHGQTVLIHDAANRAILIDGGLYTINWAARGNVYLRLVAE